MAITFENKEPLHMVRAKLNSALLNVDGIVNEINETTTENMERAEAAAILAVGRADAAFISEQNAKASELSAQGDAALAEQYKDEALAAREGIEEDKAGTESDRILAEQARDAALGYRNQAEVHKNAAQAARTGAETAETNAETAQAAAEDAEDGSVAAKVASEAARDLSLSYRNQAETFKNNASTSATTASTKATEATTAATTAATKAGEASTSAGAAATSASNANTSAGNAYSSAQAAATSASNAYGSELSAASSASSASGTLVNVEAASDAAAESAQEALASEIAAGVSETAALGYRNGTQEVFDASLRALNWTPNRAISARAVFDAKMLTAQSGGLPENSSFIAANLFGVDATYGPYVRRDLTTQNPFSTYTRPIFTMKPDSVFRIRAKVRFAQPTAASFRPTFVSADGTAQVRSIPMTGIVAGEVREYEAIIGKTAGGIVTHVHPTAADWDRPYFRGGIASTELIAGGIYDLFVLDIEDLTLLDLATRAAQAANVSLNLSVRFDIPQTLTTPQKLTAATNAGVVSYASTQTLTSPQKLLAASNIGALVFDQVQTLTDAQKTLVRTAIGMESAAEVAARYELTSVTTNTSGDHHRTLIDFRVSNGSGSQIWRLLFGTLVKQPSSGDAVNIPYGFTFVYGGSGPIVSNGDGQVDGSILLSPYGTATSGFNCAARLNGNAYYGVYRVNYVTFGRVS